MPCPAVQPLEASALLRPDRTWERLHDQQAPPSLQAQGYTSSQANIPSTLSILDVSSVSLQ